MAIVEYTNSPSSSRTNITEKAKALIVRKRSKKDLFQVTNDLIIPSISLPRRKTVNESSSYRNQSPYISPRLQSPYRTFVNDYNTLLFSFPGFPEAMMKSLILREEGNMFTVARFLKSRGWGEPGVKYRSKFNNTTDAHIQIQHFWGINKPEYVVHLQNKPIGTYYIVLVKPKYVMYYVTQVGIKSHRLSTLDTHPNCSEPGIKYFIPLSRCIDIPLSDLLLFS